MMIFKREPVFAQGVVQAAIALAAAFGLVNWSVEQIGAVLGATAAVFAFMARTQVTPNYKVPEQAKVREPAVPSARKAAE
jgi:hypothetical protein